MCASCTPPCPLLSLLLALGCNSRFCLCAAVTTQHIASPLLDDMLWHVRARGMSAVYLCVAVMSWILHFMKADQPSNTLAGAVAVPCSAYAAQLPGRASRYGSLSSASRGVLNLWLAEAHSISICGCNNSQCNALRCILYWC